MYNPSPTPKPLAPADACCESPAGRAAFIPTDRAKRLGKAANVLAAMLLMVLCLHSGETGAAEPATPPPQAVREAQTLLSRLGYQPGPADGIWGEGTRQAYQAFLRDEGQPARQTLTPSALRAMRAIAKRRGISVSENSPNAPASGISLSDALIQAVKAGNIQGVDKALSAGADPNHRDNRSWTALMHAANNGYLLLFDPLLKADADPNIRAVDGATAMFIAALHGHRDIVKRLLEAGGDPTIRGPKEKAPAELLGEPTEVTETESFEVLEQYVTQNPNGVFADWVSNRLQDPLSANVRRIGDKFRDCVECPEMVVVPAGTFRMGEPKSEEESGDSERPVHSVSVPSFAAGVYELTFAEWDACAASGGCGGHRPKDQGWGRGRRPAINVSWDDAQSYVRWLSKKTGKRYRLLSESEWEYAARAGTRTPFHTGSTISTDQANYDGNHVYGPSGRKGVYRRKTVPVGSFPANAYGLHDVHGNVWEWVQDCWNGNYQGAPGDGSAWESGDCSRRVLRGGSWNYIPRVLRSASRSGVDAGIRNNSCGFRVARTLTP